MATVFLNDDNACEVLAGKEIYIFGAGERAEELAGYIKNNGLAVRGYCVDDAYYRENQSNIMRLSDVPAGDEVAVLYGMASVNRFKEWSAALAGKAVYVWWDCLWQYDDSLMEKHKEDFARAAEVYADDLSRKIMDSYLLGKKQKGYDGEFAYCTEGTYFNELTASVLSGGAVDCGAFTGDTVRKYLDFTGNAKGKVWAFEPDPENYKKLLASCREFANVECLNYGVWDKDEILSFSANSSGDSSICDDGDIKVTCKKIDDVIGGDKVGFIKMDVEGAERQALAGASDVIRRDSPVLAISAYHLWDDLAVLPLLIDELTEDGYRIYLRHHGIAAEELVIYAIPPVNK